MIILIRHGETALNAARVVQPADTPLSERGRRQAHAVAQRLANIGFAAVLSSDLPRAAQTAEAIAAHSATKVNFSDALQERNFGDLRGRAYDELGFDPIDLQDVPPAGESMTDFRQRVACAMQVIADMRGAITGNLVVVSHGLTIRTLLEQHLLLADGMCLPEKLGNTSVTVVSAEPPHRVSVLNCTQHLFGDLGDNVRAGAV